MTLDLESEISAARARLGYRPDDPTPVMELAGELPAELLAPFWARMVEERLAELEVEGGHRDDGDVTRDPWDLTDAEVDALLAEPVPLTYWLNPRHWHAEVTAWLYQHDWKGYCFQHDVCHWAWTHRGCGCWRTTPEGRAWQARISRLLNRDDRGE